MGRRAGYFCNSWPFYSGGFADCCDENFVISTCAHSVYDPFTEGVLCDFWYSTQRTDFNRLDICDCKLNDGVLCQSWICATTFGYDLVDENKTKNEAFLENVLSSDVEIRGVDRCGYFDDARSGRVVPRWCYQYNDFTSCFCRKDDGAVCIEWKCHRFLNNAINKIPADSSWSPNGDWNTTLNVSDSELDLLALSTMVSDEVYQCRQSRSVDGLNLQSTHCTEWTANVESVDSEGNGRPTSFEVMQCDATSPWDDVVGSGSNARWTFDDEVLTLNVSREELERSYPSKWECHSMGMEYRDNEQFINFYLSTAMWSVMVGLGLLSLIFCWFQYKYITLSSFFCVQGWFLFIFGSIAAVHGGVASLSIYLFLQSFILCHVVVRKCKNRGKVPYGSLNQKYDFDPMEESVSRVSDDDRL